MNCIISAWHLHEAELRGFLSKQLRNPVQAEDILQDVFMRAMEQGVKFCHIENPRAWLFRVAKNLLIDSIRAKKKQTIKQTSDNEDLENLSLENLSLENLSLGKMDLSHPKIAVIETLDVCLPRALLDLNDEERKIIEACDLEGQTQAEYAQNAEISLAGAKSRIQRARKRLKQSLTNLCQINFDDSGNICCVDPEGKSACQI